MVQSRARPQTGLLLRAKNCKLFGSAQSAEKRQWKNDPRKLTLTLTLTRTLTLTLTLTPTLTLALHLTLALTLTTHLSLSPLTSHLSLSPLTLTSHPHSDFDSLNPGTTLALTLTLTLSLTLTLTLTPILTRTLTRTLIFAAATMLRLVIHTSLKPKISHAKQDPPKSLQSPHVLRVSQATSRLHRKAHKYLKAAQMLFRLLLAVVSPNNNSNYPEPSIHNKVFWYRNFPAKTRHEIHASRNKNRCTIQINNLEASNLINFT